MPSSHPRARAFTRSTSRSPDDEGGEVRADAPGGWRRTRLGAVVLFYELLLVACTVLITWFALYALYRLITDES